MTLTEAEIERLREMAHKAIEEAAREQGVPAKIHDPKQIARIAAILRSASGAA